MGFLNFHGHNSVSFNGHDKPAIPVSLSQYIMHYLYGANEPLILKSTDKILDVVEFGEGEAQEKSLQKFKAMSANPALQFLPHGIVMSRNAAKNVLDFVYYVEGATNGARLAVGPCICQRALEKYPNGLTEPEIKDITLFYSADIYLDLGIGFKEITNDEAKDILDEMHNRGYLHNAMYMFEKTNALFVMCNCDANICAVQRGARLTDNTDAKGPEICVRDASKCKGVKECGKCIDRCFFGANKADGDEVIFDQNKCKGCELCVTTCTGKARELTIRDDYEYEDLMSKTLLLAGKYGYERMVPYER